MAVSTKFAQRRFHVKGSEINMQVYLEIQNDIQPEAGQKVGDSESVPFEGNVSAIAKKVQLRKTTKQIFKRMEMLKHMSAEAEANTQLLDHYSKGHEKELKKFANKNPTGASEFLVQLKKCEMALAVFNQRAGKCKSILVQAFNDL